MRHSFVLGKPLLAIVLYALLTVVSVPIAFAASGPQHHLPGVKSYWQACVPAWHYSNLSRESDQLYASTLTVRIGDTKLMACL